MSSLDDPNITVSNVYFPGDDPIQVHQSRVTRCPDQFPAGFYWYGNKRRGPGHPPKWVAHLLESGNVTELNNESEAIMTNLEDDDPEPDMESSPDGQNE